MKSSTFSIFAVGGILALYAGMAALDNFGQQLSDQERHEENVRIARETCGNANWNITEVDGKLTSLRCIRRKPLNGAKVKVKP